MTSSDPTLIEILPPESDMSTSSAMVYPVRLREVGVVWEQLRSDLSLDFSCQLTGQRVRVPIYIKLVERKEILPGKFDLAIHGHLDISLSSEAAFCSVRGGIGVS